MASKRTSRKRRGSRPRSSSPESTASSRRPTAPTSGDATARAYSRSRAKDEAARAALTPLRSGERPVAVTVGAIVAGVLALANLVALVFGYNSSEDTLSVGSPLTGTLVVTGLLASIAYGMWRARYWAVLGMQTLLAITMIFATLGLVTAVNVWATLLVLLTLAAAATLFWFLVKAMARIQMPERPGAR